MTALTKEVQFNGQTLIGIINEDTGKIYTGFRKICENLGIDWSRQLKKIKSHEVLKEGVGIMSMTYNNRITDIVSYDIDYLPSWLLGIKPSKVKEEVKPMLIKYQLEAVKVLRDAFINKAIVQQAPQLPENYIQALEKLLSSEKEKLQLQSKIEQDKPKVQAYYSFLSSTTALDFSTVSKALKMGRNKLFEFCRQKELLKYNNEPYQKYVDSGLFEVIIVNKYNDSDFNQNFSKTLITPKGQEKIRMLLQGDKDE